VSNEDNKISNYCSQTFRLLDQWLVQIVKEKTGDDAFDLTQKTFQNNIQANISYYESLEEAALQNHDDAVAATNRAMVNLYKGFLIS
jgi:hypothetical protein